MTTESTKEVSSKALTVIEQANAVVVKSSEDYTLAGRLWNEIKALKTEVDNAFKPIIFKANQAHKEALAQRDKIFKPLEVAGKLVKGAMERFDREQEAIRQAEERRLREEARKAEEERRLQEAIEAEQNGEVEIAEEIMQEEVYVPPVIVEKEVPKVEGVVYRTVWKFRIRDINKVPREYLKIDEVKIGAVVRAMKQECKIPGIEVYSERV